MKTSHICHALILLASACADRFGEIGDAESLPDVEHPAVGGATSGVPTSCGTRSLASTSCRNGTPTTQYDDATCPTGLACLSDTVALSTDSGIGGSAPIPTSDASGATTTAVIGSATCVTNGCWASCSFPNGGAPPTTTVGNTSCGSSLTPPTTTVIDNATCITNGCWTACTFREGGSGGTTSNVVFGNTTCAQSTQLVVT
jgi:hypothetical protein